MNESKAVQVQSFYRIVKTNPPTDRDYVTPQARRGDPPPGLSDEERRSWDALSFHDTEEGARHQAQQVRGIGRHIVRYDISLDSGISWEQPLAPGHYDLRGDVEELKRYLTSFIVPV